MFRYCQSAIINDLEKKMVFIGGPRQVGKTTLCQTIGSNTNHYQYLNWDSDSDRSIILNKSWRTTYPLIIFDELHKYPKWKQWVKGIYDTRPSHQQFLVTGSARLDTYKRGGDSLFGRYHYWRLHPLTLDELPQGMHPEEGLHRLLTLGGFPEPFLANDLREARRWRKERFDRILREDVRDLSPLKEIQLLQVFVDRLREHAGQLIALSNIANDLQISPATAKHWLLLVETLYLAFAIYPYTKNLPRSLLKPCKIYFYDNADLSNNEGARWENLVATTLLKRLHFLEDYHGHRCQLHYVRDKEGREVDFVTIIDDVVTDLIEVKLTDTTISSSLKYYKEKLQPKRTVQIVFNLKQSFEKDGIIVTSASEFFRDPPWGQ
jgi:predicted AAA+ superfamily ATPase